MLNKGKTQTARKGKCFKGGGLLSFLHGYDKSLSDQLKEIKVYSSFWLWTLGSRHSQGNGGKAVDTAEVGRC